MSRDPESVLLEADYWRLALEDLLALNDAMPAIANELTRAHLGTLNIVARTGEVESSSDVRTHVGVALELVRDAQEPVLRLIELAGGRVKAIARELTGADPQDEDE